MNPDMQADEVPGVLGQMNPDGTVGEKPSSQVVEEMRRDGAESIQGGTDGAITTPSSEPLEVVEDPLAASVEPNRVVNEEVPANTQPAKGPFQKAYENAQSFGGPSFEPMAEVSPTGDALPQAPEVPAAPGSVEMNPSHIQSMGEPAPWVAPSGEMTAYERAEQRLKVQDAFATATNVNELNEQLQQPDIQNALMDGFNVDADTFENALFELTGMGNERYDQFRAEWKQKHPDLYKTIEHMLPTSDASESQASPGELPPPPPPAPEMQSMGEPQMWQQTSGEETAYERAAANLEDEHTVVSNAAGSTVTSDAANESIKKSGLSKVFGALNKNFDAAMRSEGTMAQGGSSFEPMREQSMPTSPPRQETTSGIWGKMLGVTEDELVELPAASSVTDEEIGTMSAAYREQRRVDPVSAEAEPLTDPNVLAAIEREEKQEQSGAAPATVEPGTVASAEEGAVAGAPFSNGEAPIQQGETLLRAEDFASDPTKAETADQIVRSLKAYTGTIRAGKRSIGPAELTAADLDTVTEPEGVRDALTHVFTRGGERTALLKAYEKATTLDGLVSIVQQVGRSTNGNYYYPLGEKGKGTVPLEDVIDSVRTGKPKTGDLVLDAKISELAAAAPGYASAA